LNLQPRRAEGLAEPSGHPCDFWAPWCGPLQDVGPVLEKIVTDAQGSAALFKVNIDEIPKSRQRFDTVIRRLRLQKNGQGPWTLSWRHPRTPDTALSCRPWALKRAAGADEALATREAGAAARDLGNAAQLMVQVLRRSRPSESGRGARTCYSNRGDWRGQKKTWGLVRPDGESGRAITRAKPSGAEGKSADGPAAPRPCGPKLPPTRRP